MNNDATELSSCQFGNIRKHSDDVLRLKPHWPFAPMLSMRYSFQSTGGTAAGPIAASLTRLPSTLAGTTSTYSIKWVKYPRGSARIQMQSPDRTSSTSFSRNCDVRVIPHCLNVPHPGPGSSHASLDGRALVLIIPDEPMRVIVERSAPRAVGRMPDYCYRRAA